MVRIRGRLTPEQGAVVMQALAAARETLYQRTRSTPGWPEDVPVETPSMEQQQADALTLLAESALQHSIDPGAPSERYQVVVHARNAAAELRPDAQTTRPGWLGERSTWAMQLKSCTLGHCSPQDWWSRS